MVRSSKNNGTVNHVESAERSSMIMLNRCSWVGIIEVTGDLCKSNLGDMVCKSDQRRLNRMLC